MIILQLTTILKSASNINTKAELMSTKRHIGAELNMSTVYDICETCQFTDTSEVQNDINSTLLPL
jgi:hypothetical protein